VRIHLVVEGGNETLCGRNRGDVVDCVDVEWYVEHHLGGTEDLMVTLATTAMVLSRLVRAFLQIETPDPETPELSGPLCHECDSCTGFYILEAYSVKHDE